MNKAPLADLNNIGMWVCDDVSLYHFIIALPLKYAQPQVCQLSVSPILRWIQAIAPPKLDHLSEKCWRLKPYFHQHHVRYQNCPIPNITHLSLVDAGKSTQLLHTSNATIFSGKKVEKLVGHINDKRCCSWKKNVVCSICTIF